VKTEAVRYRYIDTKYCTR